MCVHNSRKRIKMENLRKWGFWSKTMILRKRIDLLPTASRDEFVLDPGIEEQAGEVPLGERP